MVLTAMIAEARVPELWASSACAAVPVMPALSPVPASCAGNCARNAFTASACVMSDGLVTCGICTAMIWMSLFGEAGAANTAVT